LSRLSNSSKPIYTVDPASIDALRAMKRLPEALYYQGDLELLQRPKIAIVGSRKPSAYTRQMTALLAASLSRRGICIVSGAAMGVDAIAHKNAGPHNTIAVMANGLDIRYPAINASLIERIENEGLVLSRFAEKEAARPWSFVVRNEMVVALGDVLIVTQAERDSGTMRSVEYAQAMGKPIYVLAHRIGESEGSNTLLRHAKAQAIYDIEAFCEALAPMPQQIEDALLQYCQSAPDYEEAYRRFGEQLFEYELEGKIRIENSKVYLS
jgi:DNA processing protein